MKALCCIVLFKVFLLVGWGVLSTDSATITLSGTLRDQSPRPAKCDGNPCTDPKGNDPTGKTFGNFAGIDFEYSKNFYDLGITKATIGPNRKPEYAFGDKMSLNGTVHNQTTFDTWFNESPYTKTYPISIDLSNVNTGDARVFCYDNSSFFPLDNLGWGNEGNPHNYHFCMELHGRFAYKGGEVFSFFGDDDVFMFINNRRVIDLGGVHTILHARVELDRLGLSVGTNYLFDFFFCERHTVLSNMKICSSLEIYCAYYDWCGVCEGDGQSCCVGTDSCDDNNKCTIDRCSVINPPTSECINTPVDCNDNNICTTDSCNRDTGNCTFTTRVCDDGNKCTVDTCDPTRGGCIYTPKDCSDPQGLCTTDSCDPNTGSCINTLIKCDDGDACTKDSCSPAVGCQATRISCDDSNKCTSDSCDSAKGCQYTNITSTCSDNNQCTTDSCSPTTGCVFQNIVCDDNNKCTTDSCNPQSGCVFIPVVCNDNNPCTDDNCNPSSGCEYVAKKCSDDNACTTDSCNAITGHCVFSIVTCDDGKECTVDSCDPVLGCTAYARTCDDNNTCTIDSCDPVRGCIWTAVDCNDNDVCTNDTCDAVKGCQRVAIPCDDGDPCTEDSCDSVGGCTKKNITCNDRNACTIDSCVPFVGCSYKRISCDDGNPCTNDTCAFDSGCHRPIIFANCTLCNFKTCLPVAGDKCKPQQCDPSDGSCKPAPEIVCDDNSRCTEDRCDPATGDCVFTPIRCNDNNNCTVDFCDPALGCRTSNISCNDNNPCTSDSCIAPAGKCSNLPLPNIGCVACGPNACTFTDYCKPKICNTTTMQCQEKPVSCDDNNACTNDECVSNINGTYTCRHTAVKCTTVDVCSPMTCDPKKGCVAVPLECNDNNLCTIDTCNGTNGACMYRPKCVTTNPCTPLNCTSNGECVPTAYPCNDGNPCTNDTCTVVNGAPKCVFTTYDCPVANPCFPATCNASSGRCEAKAVNCDDSNPCSIDTCVPVGGKAVCNYTDVVCTPADLCQPEVCNATTGKCDKLAPINCDDGNNCTTESCQSGKCVYLLNPCNDNDACTVDACDDNPPNGLKPGCQHTPVVFAATNSCVTAYCDKDLGVIEELINCTSKVNLTNLCESVICDATVGCLVVNRTCLVKDLQGGEGGEDCWMAVCNPDNGQCELKSRENKESPKCAFLYLSTIEKVAVITAPILAAIIIAAVIFAALAAFAAKKAYDFMQMRHTGMGAVGNNPLYTPNAGSGTNPMYAAS